MTKIVYFIRCIWIEKSNNNFNCCSVRDIKIFSFTSSIRQYRTYVRFLTRNKSTQRWRIFRIRGQAFAYFQPRNEQWNIHSWRHRPRSNFDGLDKNGLQSIRTVRNWMVCKFLCDQRSWTGNRPHRIWWKLSTKRQMLAQRPLR